MRKFELMARICKLSYIKVSDTDYRPDEQKILEELKKIDENFIHVSGIHKGSSQAIICEHTDYIVLAFRGSDEKPDWDYNFDWKMVKALGVKIHRGFIDATFNLTTKLNWLNSINKPLYITGHSLGGAIATVYTHYRSNIGKRIDGVWTFGQPRVFGHYDAQKFDLKHKKYFFRYQNNNDLVSMVPPVFTGYSHVGQTRHIDHQGNIKHGLPMFDRLIGLFKAIPEKGIDFQEDHNLDLYICAR